MVAALLAAAAGAVPAPLVVHDAREPSPLAAVRGDAGPAIYVRDAGPWRQYWMYFEDNPHDRGLFRTGRHEGDWEVLQVRLSPDRSRVLEAVASQHSGAERCGGAQLELERGRLVVYAASGSHALYFRAGLRDRTWPDPNDEAFGDGARVAPRPVRISARSPRWMRFAGRWGRSRAAWWNPLESDSPRGPAFQGERWDDPEAFARSAHPCRAARCDARGECDTAENALAGAAAASLCALALAAAHRRRRRHPHVRALAPE